MDNGKRKFERTDKGDGSRKPNRFGNDKFGGRRRRGFISDRFVDGTDDAEEAHGADRGFKSTARGWRRSGNNDSSSRRRSVELRERSAERSSDRNRRDNRRDNDETYDPSAKYSMKKRLAYREKMRDNSQPLRLNRFIANAGFCSRRDADKYIQAGVVTVNGEIVTEMGFKVIPDKDKVMFHNQLVRAEKLTYLLLNKPKDCVTTTDDPHARITVMDIVANACKERVYPVGRLDRNTTGILLLTNDGDLAAKLTHPRYNKKKIYQVTLDEPVTHDDLQRLTTGLELEDGPIAADNVEYIREDSRKDVGVEIHSGRNRIVRRMFESLGYKVMKLDRVYFAGLTKKNLPRGKWRFLTDSEVAMLKMGSYQ